MEGNHAVQRLAFSTADVDEFLERVSPVAPGYLIDPARAGERRATVEAVRTPRLGFMSVRPCDWRVLHEPPPDFYSVTIPLEGGFESFEGVHPETVGVGRAHLLGTGSPFDIRTNRDSRYLVVNFERELVERRLRWDDCEGAERHPEPPAILNVRAREGARFDRLARALATAFYSNGPGDMAPIPLAEAEEALADGMVRAWHEGAGDDGWLTHDPRSLARAEEFIAARLGQPVSLAEVADAAGTSVRSLNRAFSSHHGVSPMRFLRLRRLEAANRALLESEPDELSVTEVALRFGLSHLGRFASAYRECFGESPSETLARSPRVHGKGWLPVPESAYFAA